MAPLTCLPDLNTLEVFSYYDPDVDAMIEIVSDDNTHPRVIADYVIDPTDWHTNNREGANYGNGIGPPNGVSTVEEVLTFKTGKRSCFICNQKGTACNGEVCVDIAKEYFRDVADCKLLIKKARWGFGVFARADIAKGTLIGEYMGRLMPLDATHPIVNAYTYTINGRADCDAERYCNMTHFINHHCNCNTDPIKAMYGKRAVNALKTNRDITAGEEITIDYGVEYFNSHVPCGCDAFPYPHTSETYRRRVSPDGSVSPSGFGTYGRYEGESGGGRTKQVVVFGSAEEKPKIQDAISDKTSKAEKLEVGPGARAKAATSKVQRRRRSWGSRAYKGGDPGRRPLRRSARTATTIFCA